MITRRETQIRENTCTWLCGKFQGSRFSDCVIIWRMCCAEATFISPAWPPLLLPAAAAVWFCNSGCGIRIAWSGFRKNSNTNILHVLRAFWDSSSPVLVLFLQSFCRREWVTSFEEKRKCFESHCLSLKQCREFFSSLSGDFTWPEGSICWICWPVLSQASCHVMASELPDPVPVKLHENSAVRELSRNHENRSKRKRTAPKRSGAHKKCRVLVRAKLRHRALLDVLTQNSTLVGKS